MSKEEIKQGEQLTLAQINRIKKMGAAAFFAKPEVESKEKELTVPKIKEELTAKGIEFPSSAKRDELLALLKEQ